ncbi:MAG TPA: ABC transporter permease subunit [Jatrophihabitantaceae bacterium]|jgi:ABC-type nitrate/sulfonate/bicarbonate transport system permease component|nr:ABC transporter permease subunit [Jatrophihabitantaceae bacterium]
MQAPVAVVDAVPPDASGTAGEPATATSRYRLTTAQQTLGAGAGIVVIGLVWWLLAVTVFEASRSVPTPAAVLRQYIHDGWHLYWSNAIVTTWSAVQGFFWGNLLAIVLAATVLLVPALEGVASQIAVISYCIPLTAIGPVILIIAPTGSRYTSIVLAALSVFFTTVVGCLLGLRAADRAALDVVRAYGGGRWQQLRRVQVIASLPSVFAALRLAAPAAFLGAVLGEYFGGIDSGLGVAITAAQSNLRVAQLWSLALLCGLIAGAWFAIIGLAGRLLTPWSGGPASGNHG